MGLATDTQLHLSRREEAFEVNKLTFTFHIQISEMLREMGEDESNDLAAGSGHLLT